VRSQVSVQTNMLPHVRAERAPVSPKRTLALRLFGYYIFIFFAMGPLPRGTRLYNFVLSINVNLSTYKNILILVDWHQSLVAKFTYYFHRLYI
jgi:hypothetical protein